MGKITVTESECAKYMSAAKAWSSRVSGVPEGDLWVGYIRGLRRARWGSQFGTDEEHALWLDCSKEKRDQQRRYRGLGYKVGLAGTSFTAAMEEFREIIARTEAASSLGARKSPAKTEAARAMA